MSLAFRGVASSTCQIFLFSGISGVWRIKATEETHGSKDTTIGFVRVVFY
ncbi:hypothetical protein HanPI659440_Chr13g0502541 [Helianthus annuus]|nr:hypothetical protein HanPI659440_Chr13g0502541 [Helianthus annuus]